MNTEGKNHMKIVHSLKPKGIRFKPNRCYLFLQIFIKRDKVIHNIVDAALVTINL